MKALVKQQPPAQAEVFFASQWLDWMDPDTGAPLTGAPYGYALAEDAPWDDPRAYIIADGRAIPDPDWRPQE